jgi:hypothetical protein
MIPLIKQQLRILPLALALPPLVQHLPRVHVHRQLVVDVAPCFAQPCTRTRNIVLVWAQHVEHEVAA